MLRMAYPLITLAGFAAVLLLLATGVGYQQGAFTMAQALGLLRIGALLGIAGAGFSIFFMLWQRPQGLNLVLIVLSAMLGIVAFYMPYRQLLLAQQLPAIHDITTDFQNPPTFVAIARVRVAAPNPLAYDGPEVAALQRQAYPDIRTLTLAHSPEEVFETALQLVEELGWDIAEANLQQGRIEATVTSLWFALKDDVVIRVVPGPDGGTVFDMRSKSRLGITDVGSNARHIRELVEGLNARLH